MIEKCIYSGGVNVISDKFTLLLALYHAKQVQGRVVRKPISANPGLKVNREFNFFCIEVFLLFMFCED